MGRDIIGPIIIVVTLLQSMWLTAWFPAGFFTSFAAGLVLAMLLAEAPPSGSLGSTRFVLVSLLGVSVVANTWPLLMPVALAALAVAGARGCVHLDPLVRVASLLPCRSWWPLAWRLFHFTL